METRTHSDKGKVMTTFTLGVGDRKYLQKNLDAARRASSGLARLADAIERDILAGRFEDAENRLERTRKYRKRMGQTPERARNIELVVQRFRRAR